MQAEPEPERVSSAEALRFELKAETREETPTFKLAQTRNAKTGRARYADRWKEWTCTGKPPATELSPQTGEYLCRQPGSKRNTAACSTNSGYGYSTCATPTCPNTSTRAGSNATASSSRIAKDGFKRRTCRRQCRLSVGNKEEAKPPSQLLSLKLHLTIPLLTRKKIRKDGRRSALTNCATSHSIWIRQTQAASSDNVPAYVRRNMELFGNTLTSVEQFYSKYTVKKEDNDENTYFIFKYFPRWKEARLVRTFSLVFI